MNIIKNSIYILAIETSCDETSIAIMKNDSVVECLTWSHIKNFAKTGGVIPQLASQLHMEKLAFLMERIIKNNPKEWKKINYVAFTAKPGLVGCLRMGETAAKTIALEKNVPLIPINHLEGHIYAAALIKPIIFPALALVVSGGHTQLVYLAKELDFKIIGHTIDDAAGEVIDKIARKIGLNYPGGPEIEKIAQKGQPKYKLNVYKNSKDLNFSFSGLKTSAVNFIDSASVKTFSKADLAASLQNTIFYVLAKKINLAQKKHKVKNLILGGGVAANQALRDYLRLHVNLPLQLPEKKYCGDNAAMIGILAFYKIKN